MDAYYNTYTILEPVDEFLRDVNVKASNPIFSEHLKARAAQGWAGIPPLCGHPQADALPAQWYCSVIEGGSAGLD